MNTDLLEKQLLDATKNLSSTESQELVKLFSGIIQELKEDDPVIISNTAPTQGDELSSFSPRLKN